MQQALENGRCFEQFVQDFWMHNNKPNALYYVCVCVYAVSVSRVACSQYYYYYYFLCSILRAMAVSRRRRQRIDAHERPKMQVLQRGKETSRGEKLMFAIFGIVALCGV